MVFKRIDLHYLITQITFQVGPQFFQAARDLAISNNCQLKSEHLVSLNEVIKLF